jgi:hypothetical protein
MGVYSQLSKKIGMQQLIDWLYKNRYVIAKVEFVRVDLQKHVPLSKEHVLRMIPNIINELE